MERRMILSVLAVAVFGFIGVMLLMPEATDDGVPRLPWLVDQDATGRTQVFGFTLGETRLAEVRDVLGEEGEINLFVQPNGGKEEDAYAVEAYFEHIYLNHLRADFVVSLAVDQATLESMYQRGLRISQLGSGAKKVELAPEDVALLREAPIEAITYLPWKSLDAQILRNRFGVPSEKRVEPETSVTHWLYPEKGMDIAIDTKGGVVIQYVNAAEFDRILRPLPPVRAIREPAANSPTAKQSHPDRLVAPSGESQY